MEVNIRRARTADVRGIRQLIDLYATERRLLSKATVALFEDVPEFWVATLDDRVVGCGALHVMWEDLAEVRTVAVHPSVRGRRIGHQLVAALLAGARDLGVRKVFCLTFETGFFASFGFVPIDGAPVPPKVYEELLRSYDEGVAEFLDLERVKPNTLGNTRMLLRLDAAATHGRVMNRVAAIDCGTNSIRLLVADLPDDGGPLVDVSRRMEIVRLGEGVDRTGRLSTEAIERTRVALAGYAKEISELGASRVRMVATSASRDASNAADFRAMVRATLGSDPEVATGDEEARLSFTGAVRGLPSRYPAPYLVVDIGGGSTEFVRGTSSPDAAISVDIGCVRMTERHLRADPPTSAQIEAATADITAAVDRALTTVDGSAAATVLGLAGSVTTVAAIALGLREYQPDRIHHSQVSTVDVARVTDELLGMARRQRLDIPAMHPGRADVIGAGALILRVILERVGADAVVASEHDILDGIAWSLAP